MQKKHQLNYVTILLVSLVLTGTIGYKILLELSFLDALYMTVITISTVGYAEVGVMDTEAKIFSIFLIFISLGTVGYLFTSIISSFFRRRLEKCMEAKKNGVKYNKAKKSLYNMWSRRNWPKCY